MPVNVLAMTCVLLKEEPSGCVVCVWKWTCFCSRYTQHVYNKARAADNYAHAASQLDWTDFGKNQKNFTPEGAVSSTPRPMTELRITTCIDTKSK